VPDLTDSPIPWVARHIRGYPGTRRFNGRDTLLITTRGRRTGTLRRTALYYARDGDRYVVVASGGGEPIHPAWYLNLVANPDVVLQVGADTFLARARTATPAERPALWSAMVAIFPRYTAYQAATTRELPVVLLTPQTAAAPPNRRSRSTAAPC
jgi:deazaflavin-dependent oxidoreductase (nitroreductase family)